MFFQCISLVVNFKNYVCWKSFLVMSWNNKLTFKFKMQRILFVLVVKSCLALIVGSTKGWLCSVRLRVVQKEILRWKWNNFNLWLFLYKNMILKISLKYIFWTFSWFRRWGCCCNGIRRSLRKSERNRAVILRNKASPRGLWSSRRSWSVINFMIIVISMHYCL